jgi:DNA polymerase I-like protein with 3'-5' exonuclease and polymerase domains
MQRLLTLGSTCAAYVVATLHDEILFDVPKDRLHSIIPQIRGVMEEGYCGIPTPTDIAIFPDSWEGEGIPVEEYLK